VMCVALKLSETSLSLNTQKAEPTRVSTDLVIFPLHVPYL
jgi:hypothetical protein